ncbi:MAG: hypothetical protein PVJ67_02225 [Candidatus Pacearchaeota archaeon]|jgi:hypothetical protein
MNANDLEIQCGQEVNLGYFSNKYQPNENTIYLGRATNLVFEFDHYEFVDGTAILTRYDKAAEKRSLSQKIKSINSPFHGFFKKWSIKSTRKESQNRESFIFGEELTDYDTQLGWNMTGYSQRYYRTSFLNFVLPQNRQITKELLAKVFNPIDREIMKKYKQILQSEEFSKFQRSKNS